MMLRVLAHSAALVAVILLASVTATRAFAQQASESQLQSLVDDTAFQLELSYRFNVTELTRRREQVSQALAAWNESPRSESDNRALTEWLRAAIRTSMPGSQDKLPPLPNFEKPIAVEPLPVPPANRPATSTKSAIAPKTAEPSSATEHTLMRPTSAVTETDPAPLRDTAPEQQQASATGDFWSEHPASEELPADFSSGDPFLDDPLPTGESLESNEPLPTDDDLFFE